MGFTATLSGGSAYGTLNLNDHVNYSVGNYTPTVSMLQTGLIGEGDPYKNQIEELIINVYGSTPAAAVTNLKKLVNKIEQAEKWAAGESLVSNPAVIFSYTPQDSGQAWQAAVYGSPEGADSLLQLQPAFNRDLQAYVIKDVTLLIDRRGAWLGATQTDDLTAAPAGSPMEVQLTGRDHLSPTKLRILFPSNAFALRSPGYVVLTDCGAAADNMFIGSPGDEITFALTGFARQARDSTERPYSSTHYLRCDPLGAGVVYEQLIDAVMNGTPFTPNANMIAVFAAVRNTNQLASFNIWLALGQEQRFATGEVVYVDKSSDDPQIVCFGIYPTAGLPVTFQKIVYEADNAAGILDIDYIFAVGLNNSSAILYLDAFTVSDTEACNPGGGSSSEFYLFVDPGQLTSPDPAVYATNLCDQTVATGRFAKAYQGNAYLATKSANMGLALLFPYLGFWRYINDADGSNPLYSFNVQVIRQTADLAAG
jgi:hypothetical protein